MDYMNYPRWNPSRLAQGQATTPPSPPTGFTPPVTFETSIATTTLAGTAAGAITGLLYGVLFERKSMAQDATIGGAAGFIASTLARLL